MIRESAIENVYLAKGNTDLRKSIDGLSILVQESFHLDPFSPCLFVFCNRKRDKLKILHWEYNGFWLYYKRLEKGTFQWPKAHNDAPSLKISRRQLNWLLDGLSLEQREAHRAVKARTLI
ncbi:IS66 family insertion sequence element accessory protein TnpB [Sporolactobacillus sp. CQH2019]|uniref:IS66 family insertion sequence element accessory protein TnpB n=1 Tax=Sporolactobacillus sp. CQH2019 TaxID=3023512 RepID=UPI0023683789|nr:IS66 family insertion sequence element accessory protein TnpB [Sporolactobacillus sp. CQH2019]MDD9150191.1 IS66 family insertion sequence element accessory protein TnpB [Sporolactobacillus sp. CQH2019]